MDEDSKMSTEVEDKESKFPSPSKCLSLTSKDSKSTLNALATEIKEALANKIKQAIDEKFNQCKELNRR